MATYINCLSVLENKTALLYKNLSEKTQIPLAKSILISIAQDSSKHSALLKGIGDSILVLEVNDKDCAKSLGQTWQTVTTQLKMTTKNQEISLAELYETLVALESNVGEEYNVFVQMKTLTHLSKIINQAYNTDLDKIKGILESIIKDEEHHRELLGTLKELSEPKRKDNDYTPIVKYQNPDQWTKYVQ